MATVYLCIGTQKTGTTSLQRFMAMNKEALRKQGFCYPGMDFLGFESIYNKRNGHFLAYLSFNEERVRNREEERKKREEAYSMLAQAAKEYPNIVLSDEVIWYQCKKYKNFWQEVVEEFKKINCEVKVVVYLRRQDLVLQSLWNQRVKRKPCITQTFDEWLQENGHKWFPLDYYGHLMKIAKVVGKENIFVRVFEKGQFEGAENSLLSDYMQTIGLQMTDEFIIDKQEVNFALSGNFIKMKQIMNSMPEYLEMDNFMWEELVSASVCQASQNKHEKTSMLSYEEGQLFMQQFEEGNRRVAQEFLGREDGVLFREPIPNLPKWRGNEETMNRDMLTFLLEMFCKYENEIRELNTRIEDLEKEMGIVGREQKKLANRSGLVSKGYRKVKRMIKNGALQ